MQYLTPVLGRSAQYWNVCANIEKKTLLKQCPLNCSWNLHFIYLPLAKLQTSCQIAVCHETGEQDTPKTNVLMPHFETPCWQEDKRDTWHFVSVPGSSAEATLCCFVRMSTGALVFHFCFFTCSQSFEPKKI